jgi:hypothetical protein
MENKSLKKIVIFSNLEKILEDENASEGLIIERRYE